jgi:eukaryotic-like serine/threonine-protein kinase
MLRPTRIGRYDVAAVLGRAAMGTFYKATDAQTGRAVAVRTIDFDVAEEGRAEFEAIFRRDASAARLNHPNIVPIQDVGTSDGIAYIATDYPEGNTLRELLGSGATPPIELVADIAVDVANALNYAHENHVVHGDIQPENILITPGGDVKIMNFGIGPLPTGTFARPDAIPAPGPYAAPEQVVGGNIDGRTDVFSLGVVLYEMLTGVTPFDGDDPGAVADRVLREAPVPPSTLNVRVPPALDRIVGRALAKRPRDRYPTALALARDLQDPEAYGPAVGNGTATTLRASATRAGQRDTLAGASSPIEAAGDSETAAAPSRKAEPRRKPLMLAVPILLIAAVAIYLQGQQPRRDAPVVALPTPAAPALPLEAAPPAVPAPPADPPRPEDSGPPVALSSAPAAKPKLAPRPKPPARPNASANAPEARQAASVPPPVAVAPANATLSLAISPWGEVYVDGKRVGVSPPLTTLRLEAGTYRVEIRNQAFEPYRDTVSLEPDTSLRIKHRFR